MAKAAISKKKYYEQPTLDSHMLGWCDEVTNYAGSAEAHYNVRKSRTPKSDPGCAPITITISGGTYIAGGVEFSLASRDPPVHVSQDDYI
ncbi:hypothetical protein EG328_005671 [Venturia inaequalis]|uniref:Uncharacterized protein n=1 Tax=Venturia inaequalis TaxID=5025 RepID=A0A8H3VEG6_VENIN|nr:hypothetical protein EG328_005671 [Venturia inaequalis]